MVRFVVLFFLLAIATDPERPLARPSPFTESSDEERPPPRRRLRKRRVIEDASEGDGEGDRVSAVDASNGDIGDRSDTPAPTSAVRRVYLLTFAHPRERTTGRLTPADMTKGDFAAYVVGAYSETNKELDRWAVFEERHAGGLPHFHMVVRCTIPHRWRSIAGALREKRIYIHVSTSHSMYHTAFAYCYLPSRRKPASDLDPSPLLSDGHPDAKLAAMPPRTARAIEAQQSSQASTEEADGTNGTPKKKRRPSRRLMAYRAISGLGLTTVEKFKIVATAMDADGDSDLLEFALGCKDLDAFIKEAISFQEAPEVAKRRETSKVDILHAAKEDPCICNGDWYRAAEEVLETNNIPNSEFCSAVLSALKFGPQKKRNVYLHGPQSCGKSFLLEPLGRIFRAFKKPQQKTSFPLVGLPSKEVVLWHDFRYDTKEANLAWCDLLLWFEGKAFNIATPKNWSAADLEHTPTAPVFVTAKRRLVHPDDGETRMMDERFNYIELTKSMATIRHIPDCSRCFSCFVFDFESLHTHEPAGTVKSGDVANWDVAQVAAWVTGAGYPEAAKVLATAGVDGEVLLEMNTAKLEHVGVGPYGVAVKLARRLGSLK